MRIIRGNQRQLAPLGQQEIGNRKAIRAVTAHGTAVVVNLDRMGGGDGARIRQGQPRPLRMGNRHEGTSRDRAGGNLGPGFLPRHRHEAWRVRGRKIGRQADGENVPQLTIGHGARMQFCPQNGGKARIAHRHSVHNRIAKGPDKMVGQGHEIIAFGLVAAAHLFRAQDPVRAGGMGVQIAAPKAALGGEGGILMGHCGLLGGFPLASLRLSQLPSSCAIPIPTVGEGEDGSA